MTKIPLSLYVHFPWCLSKCPYCDFNSYRLPEEYLNNLYVDKMLDDLETESQKVFDRELISIYFGGGTPSLLSGKLIKKIVDRSRSFFVFSDKIEITLEANPGTLDLEKILSFKDAGINRISLGVQSFNDDKLKSIGRIYNTNQAIEAINFIKTAKFHNFNLDLMFGLPEQNVGEVVDDLKLALEFTPPHISWYQLTIEPKTKFAISPPTLPQNEKLWDIEQTGKKFMVQSGYAQYEVSAFCKTGYECRHNINYWKYGDYLGIGAGAHGKITYPDGTIKRFWKIANPKKYLQTTGSLIAGEKTVTAKELPFEFMLNALRLYEPVEQQLFFERTGLKFEVITKQLQQAQDFGLIELQKNVIVTTSKGKVFLNDLIEIFM